MNATRQQLHTLVDIVDEVGLDTLYNVMIRFIPEDDPLPDEIAAHAAAMDEFRRGETVSDADINWD
ncbi:MAG: hypothetical protein FWD25_05405 [Clostridia bacterium]|nr:hypothetical protein [Clostridia bacterium]